MLSMRAIPPSPPDPTPATPIGEKIRANSCEEEATQRGEKLNDTIHTP